MKFMKSQDVKVIQSGLKLLTPEDLGTVMSLLKGRSGRKDTCEQKAVRVIELVHPMMQKMNLLLEALGQRKQAWTEELVCIMADEYMSYDEGSGECKFGLVQLLVDAQKECDRREALREVGHVEQPRQSGCVVS